MYHYRRNILTLSYSRIIYYLKLFKKDKISTQNQVKNWVDHFAQELEVKCHTNQFWSKDGGITSCFLVSSGSAVHSITFDYMLRIKINNNCPITSKWCTCRILHVPYLKLLFMSIFMSIVMSPEQGTQ